jgi:hypothetical protein
VLLRFVQRGQQSAQFGHPQSDPGVGTAPFCASCWS